MRARLLIFVSLVSACAAADAQERIVRSTVREYVVPGTARSTTSPRGSAGQAYSVSQRYRATRAASQDYRVQQASQPMTDSQAVNPQVVPETYAGGSNPVSWHAGYYYTAWGKPVPLVVPPTANYQTHWGWGVCNTRVTAINAQFVGPMNGYPYDGLEGFRPTPYWPRDTDQLGVYYIRGPW